MTGLSTRIENVFKELVSFKPLYEIMDYSLFPAGKLFRPNLCLAMALDYKYPDNNPNLDYLMAAIEFHHVYSLIHDDLPCMDNDNTRRNRPSSHIKYNEWKALLAGDALINLSYESLASIRHPKAIEIIKNFSADMGANGLIAGQYIDLSENSPDWKLTLEMHRLKTAKLISFSLKSTLLLVKNDVNNKETLEIENLGKFMGINFQLYDDLTELNASNSVHEHEVNAFLRFPAEQVCQSIRENNSHILNTFERFKLKKLKSIYLTYLKEIKEHVNFSAHSFQRENLFELEH